MTRPWVKIWITSLAFFLVMFASTESYLRGLGAKTSVASDRDLWAQLTE